MNEIPYYLPVKALGNLRPCEFSDGDACELLEGSIESHAEIYNRMLQSGEFDAKPYPANVNIQKIHTYARKLKEAGLDIGGAFGFKMPHPGDKPTRFLIIYRK
jgi:hypothetical protein